VIIDAIKESRKIFQRMNSYAIYRIAETLRVLLFMTLAILVFNFYPVTAIMIVMLALLNDGAILSIAYDNVRYKMTSPKPGTCASCSASPPCSASSADRRVRPVLPRRPRLPPRPRHVQTLMYLKLSVAGHLTIFLTRTRGPFWSIRPARILLLAVLGTQAIATLIAVYGLFMTPARAGAGPRSSGATPSSGSSSTTASSCSPTGSSTDQELEHDFLWRTTAACPNAAGSASSTAPTTRTCSSPASTPKSCTDTDCPMS
jgi:hypothetical protein